MANIIEHLKKILSARKGEEVRSSIHDSIKAMNDQIENDLGGMIEDGNEVIEAMQEEIQSVETMKENGELNMKPEDLTEAQWANLKSDLTNYYKRYESIYTTTQENETNIPINISQYNTLAILEVYIEGRMLNREEYTINGTNSITLNIPLSEIGTKVHFIVYRSVCASNEDLNELKGPKGDSGAIVFNTVADMKADEDLAAGDTVQTLGYYSANDGGAGLYKIVDDNTLLDDGGSIHNLVNGLKAKLIEDHSTVKYIFPKNWDTSFSGDANLIITCGKSILIDTHQSYSKDGLYEMLRDNEVNHIDYLIITHYHRDHMGNVANLINDGYIDRNTQIYLPAYCNLIENSTDYLKVIYDEVINAIENANLTYTIPTENQVLKIGNSLKITFYNCDTDVFNASGWTNYNECSTICLIEHNNIKSLYTGDALNQALNRALNNGFIKEKIDLYKIEHHSIEYNSSLIPVLKTLSPDYAVLPSTLRDSQRNNQSISSTLTYLQNIGTKIFAVHKNFDYIIFNDDGFNISVEKGIMSKDIAKNDLYQDFYVDINTTNTLQNGTSQYPFKELSQALGEISNAQTGDCRIYLADGTYNISQTDDANKNIPRLRNVCVSIYGNSNDNSAVVIDKGFRMSISNVNIYNCTIISHGADCITTYGGGSLILSNVVISNSNTEKSNSAINSKNTYLNLISCTFENFNIGVNSHDDNVFMLGPSFANDNVAIQLSHSILAIQGATFTDVTTKINKYNASRIISKFDRVLLNNDNSSNSHTTYPLTDDITNYNKLAIGSGEINNPSYYTDMVYAYKQENFKVGNTYIAHAYDGTQLLIEVTNSKQLTITGGSYSAGNYVRTIFGYLENTGTDIELFK